MCVLNPVVVRFANDFEILQIQSFSHIDILQGDKKINLLIKILEMFKKSLKISSKNLLEIQAEHCSSSPLQLVCPVCRGAFPRFLHEFHSHSREFSRIFRIFRENRS